MAQMKSPEPDPRTTHITIALLDSGEHYQYDLCCEVKIPPDEK